MRSLLAAALLLVACSSGPDGSGAASPLGSLLGPEPTPLPPEPALPPLGPDCPATWAAASALVIANCTTNPGTCHYAEGVCNCGGPPVCRGAPPDFQAVPPGWEGPPPHAPIPWVCTARGPRRRADGCPRDEPRGGFACTGAPAECSYGDCGTTRYECRDGAWVVAEMVGPPP